MYNNHMHSSTQQVPFMMEATFVKAKDEFKLHYDRWHMPAPEIKVGD
jgi:hypothetical protein